MYNVPMTKNTGKIIVPGDVNVWPHEYQTALSLACAGYTVEVIRRSSIEYENSADVMIAGQKWEIKSARTSNIKAIERNLKRARWQSENVIFDSRRMKKIPDKAIERELRKRFHEIDRLKNYFL